MPGENRFHILDLIRFFAAFAVMLYHLTARPESSFDALEEFTRFGFLGVPIFFMLSGFVISISANGRTAYEFGVSRFARLYPGLWACIAITIGVLYLANGHVFDPYRVAANFTLLNDYIGQKNIDDVYWTLQAELKFYACIFLLVLFNVFHRFNIWLTAWTALAVIHAATGEPWFMGWFITPAWSPFFIIGVVLYHAHQKGFGRFNIAIFATASALAAFNLFQMADGFLSAPSVYDRLACVAIVALAGALLAMSALGVISIRGNRYIFLAGALTYPLYLLHNQAGKAIIDASTGHLPEWLAVILAIGLVFVASYGVYRWIERPAGKAIKQYANRLPGMIPRFSRLSRAKDQD
jgi:peptidoglycan/LPS O-acetylase OafA/YrhL